jgi:hypothetical protein
MDGQEGNIVYADLSAGKVPIRPMQPDLKNVYERKEIQYQLRFLKHEQ